ncbi:unnamed protein product [Rhodiola kirilowii]
MGEKKVTVMILKVDLQCDCCYIKVKKLLCKFPEIRDRIFDEKSNTVMITVICCNPEKIRDKLCNKGRGSIKSIEIKEPDPPKPKEITPPPAAKSKPPKQPPPPDKAPDPVPKIPDPVQDPPKPQELVPKPPNSAPKPVEPYPMFGSEPIPTCCEQCYGGRAGGPCNYGYGAPSQIYYDGYYNGRIVGYIGYGPNGPNRICHPGRCADYFSEENPVGCSVM